MARKKRTHPAPRRLSHVGRGGAAAMVDVGDKTITARRAVAEATVRVSAALAKAIRANGLKKGSLCDTARLAGIQAAKRTDELIPLCHSLPLDGIDVDVSLVGRQVLVRAEARVHARTGVEMEALVAVAVAALTVIDMGKSIDPAMVVEGLRLIEKEGGRSGHYLAPRRVIRGRRA